MRRPGAKPDRTPPAAFCKWPVIADGLDAGRKEKEQRGVIAPRCS